MAEAEGLQDGTGREPPGPIVLAINICDLVIRDQVTKKVSLIGLFGVIWAKGFPCKHPLMNIHVAMTGGHGKQDIEIRLVRVADEKPIMGIKGPMDFPGPLQVVELALAWQNVGFEKPGEYAVEVYCGKNAVPLASRKFNVLELDTKSPKSEVEET